MNHLQDSLKAYFSFAYAEQACAAEFREFMENLLCPESYNLEACIGALNKLPTWKDTLRPGQAKKLEIRVYNCLDAWCKASLPPEETDAALGLDSEGDGQDAEGQGQNENKPSVHDIFQVLRKVPAGAMQHYNKEVKDMTKRLETCANKEAQIQKVGVLESACMALLSESCSPESRSKFIEVGRQSTGLVFSENLSSEDRGISVADIECWTAGDRFTRADCKL